MLIGPVLKDPPPSVSLSGEPVDRVTVFKLLGVHVASDLKWSHHVDVITSKAAARLHFLKQLKRSGAGRDDLLCFYGTMIRSVLEYACPVWHTSLNCCADEGIRVAEDGDYMLSLIRAGFDTLEAQRKQLTEHFFRRSVLPEMSCLHYLLPSKRDVSVTNRLHHVRTLEHLKCRTVKFRHSFIPNCLDHYV